MDNVAENSNNVKTDEVIGVDVINNANENLGKIYELVLNKQSGQVVYAVLESGSFLGLGGKFFAIPWKSFRYDVENDSFIFNCSKEKLKAAPGFDKDNWPTFSDAGWNNSINDYYSGL